MKRLILAVLLSAPLVGLHAQQVSHAMLKLRLSDGSPISVNIDGQFISRNTSILRLDGLAAGQHKVEVYRNRDNNRKPKRIFTGTISLDPGTVYIGLVDLSTQRLRMKTRAYDASRDGGQVAAASQPWAPTTDADATDAATGTGFGSFPEGKDAVPARPDFSSNPVPKGVVPQSRMTTLEKQVMAKTTDGDRIKVLKSNLMNAKVSVAQLDALFSWLNFESSRLELLQWILPRVADRPNLEQLGYRFSLEENRQAFEKQIQN